MLGNDFILHHCWIFLENDDKWRNHLSKKKKRNMPSTSVGEGLVVNTDDEGSSRPTHLSSIAKKRLHGRKKAKDMRANGGDNCCWCSMHR
jgi:hypothetical protein